MTRRSLLTAVSPMLAACSRGDGAHFGRTEPPRLQRLGYLIGAELATLDRAKSADLWEGYIMHELFAGLTILPSQDRSADGGICSSLRAISRGPAPHTFHLRGHNAPRGERLPNTPTLRGEYRSGRLGEDLARGPMLASAAGVFDAAARTARLTAFEHYLSHGMPFLPLGRDVWPYVKKPYVNGIAANLLDRQQLKYVWIDTRWRPQ
jgi:hypothetical protein